MLDVGRADLSTPDLGAHWHLVRGVADKLLKCHKYPEPVLFWLASSKSSQPQFAPVALSRLCLFFRPTSSISPISSQPVLQPIINKALAITQTQNGGEREAFTVG